MRKVLIITYYWPPSGGSPVLRWLHFVKNLPEQGWQPIIYTPKNPSPQAYDTALEQEVPERIQVLKTKIWEPYSFYNLLLGRKRKDLIPTAFLSEEKGKGWIKKLGNYIRSNWFIPDARKFWIKPSIKYLTNRLVDNSVDLVVSSGPPHSMHMIGLGIKRKLQIPWIADFRDPWTKIDYYKDLLLSAKSDILHHNLEGQVLKKADAVLTVSPGMTREFMNKGANKGYTLTNGYDDTHVSENHFSYDKFSLLHIGSVTASRNAKILWESLGMLINEIEELDTYLEIQFVGSIDHSVIQSLEHKGLTKYVKHTPFIPNKQVIDVATHAAILLLLINNTRNAKGILTNKFFEYLAARRPILAIGPADGDVATILSETKSGDICDFNDRDNLISLLRKYFTYFKDKKLEIQSTQVENYSRKNITRSLANIFNTILKD